MVSGTGQTARSKTQEALPSLLVGRQHTTHSALHNLLYVGPLVEWDDFDGSVWEACHAHNWKEHQHILDHRHNSRFYISSVEMSVCGDETGVHGRWNQQAGQVMSCIFGSQMINLRHSDFKATASKYKKVPDAAFITPEDTAIVIGEIKCPWVKTHCIGDAVNEEKWFRILIGES